MALRDPQQRPLRRFSRFIGEESSPFAFHVAKRCRAMGAIRLTRENLHWLRPGFAAAILFGFSLPALASLGGTSNSVEIDSARMNASRQATQHDSYVVHEMKAPQGTVVNEYVSPQGKVFAVSWHGPYPPSMQQILGTYFQQYVSGLRVRPRVYGHPPVDLQLPGLVVQTSLYMGSYSGRAYLPDLLPQGTKVDQIQ
jgi:hypothetical protein